MQKISSICRCHKIKIGHFFYLEQGLITSKSTIFNLNLKIRFWGLKNHDSAKKLPQKLFFPDYFHFLRNFQWTTFIPWASPTVTSNLKMSSSTKHFLLITTTIWQASYTCTLTPKPTTVYRRYVREKKDKNTMSSWEGEGRCESYSWRCNCVRRRSKSEE